MPAPSLRVIDGGSSEEDTTGFPDVRHPTPDARRPTPYWWRWLVVQLLRHGKFFPPLWPSLVILRVLRSWSIRRAMQTMRGDLDFDGSDDFNYIAAFLRVEEERRNDPKFWALCERAIFTGRITIFSCYPVILDEEIVGRGQKAIINHLGWTVSCRLPDPLPYRFMP